MTKPTNWLGAQRRLRSAWASAQYDQSLRCKTQISLGICSVWSESLLSAWRNLGTLATHWAQSEDSDQTGRMPRLIWVFAGRTLILLVLSCRGSHDLNVSSVLKAHSLFYQKYNYQSKLSVSISLFTHWYGFTLQNRPKVVAADPKMPQTRNRPF